MKTQITIGYIGFLVILFLLTLVGCAPKGGDSSPNTAMGRPVGVFDGSYTLQSTTCQTPPMSSLQIAQNIMSYTVSVGLSACNDTASTYINANGTENYTQVNCDTSSACVAAMLQAGYTCDEDKQYPQGAAAASTLSISGSTLTINNAVNACVSIYQN